MEGAADYPVGIDGACQVPNTPALFTPRAKRNQAGFAAGLKCFMFKPTEMIKAYALRFLRKNRAVLAANGSSSNAPAIIVLGSGTKFGSLNAVPY